MPTETPTETAAEPCAGPGPVAHRLAEVAARTPTAPAVHTRGAVWTHAQLDRAAALLAGRLRAVGVRGGDAVAVLLPKGGELVAAYLAVWRTGGHALLLDPTWPGARLDAALRAAGRPAAVLTADDVPFDVPRVRVAAGSLDRAGPGAAPVAGPGPVPHDDALAYVVFTSGSTGAPKPVGVTHGSVAHSTWTHRAAHRITPRDRSAWLAPAGASSQVGEVWPYLATGASVVVPPEGTTASAQATRRWLLDEAVTTAYVSMPLAERLLALPWPAAGVALRLVTVGSDAVRRWADPALPFEVAVSLGSAEANGISSGLVPWADRVTSRTASPRLRAERPPVGRPWPGVAGRVTTPELAEAPPGAVGELTVSGPEIALGYLSEPGRTAVAFVPDPRAERPGGRTYRTGDLCSLAPDGLLRHHGRVDRQTKIRGHRVDPAGVEAVLLTCPGVVDAVVVPEPGPGGHARLAAHLVCAAGLRRGDVRSALSAALPSHAVPTVWYRMSELPRTATGKVDRAALAGAAGAEPLPGGDAPATPPEAHRPDPVLTAVLGAWRETLGRPDCPADGDFFDLGGDSLTAADLAEAIGGDLGLRVRLRDIYTRPTPRLLSSHLAARIGGAATGEGP
ncbi:non-ribosomal peptide synthetase [Streptomyces triticirhizae]|uniref:Carrier domain-containing protein n=1 Tax=Streptomyces triticirhizae TaxID=2483353 RepID=A0A3M2LJQ7_9ACTN|nr:non-ribosomal peptide synthetase [Streptomyces triticirhizae]RMI36245.1 hypothetical protein EBN88_22050 [Streptomyces triticirhizae]